MPKGFQQKIPAACLQVEFCQDTIWHNAGFLIVIALESFLNHSNLHVLKVGGLHYSPQICLLWLQTAVGKVNHLKCLASSTAAMCMWGFSSSIDKRFEREPYCRLGLTCIKIPLELGTRDLSSSNIFLSIRCNRFICNEYIINPYKGHLMKYLPI